MVLNNIESFKCNFVSVDRNWVNFLLPCIYKNKIVHNVFNNCNLYTVSLRPHRSLIASLLPYCNLTTALLLPHNSITAASLRHYCSLTSVSLQPHCNLAANWLRPHCGFTAASFQSHLRPHCCLPHCSLTAVSLQPHDGFIAASLRLYCSLTAASLRLHCSFTAASLQPHSGLIVWIGIIDRRTHLRHNWHQSTRGQFNQTTPLQTSQNLIDLIIFNYAHLALLRNIASLARSSTPLHLWISLFAARSLITTSSDRLLFVPGPYGNNN